MRMLLRLVVWMLRRNGPPPTAKGFDEFIRHYHPEARRVSEPPETENR